ncbi:DUF1565 domain-containing protein [candidate division KSB1 bacterium]|nr:DUF1565 domain-containing protein [candidate division KSB1 bacterium]
MIDGNKQGTVVTFASGEDSTTVLSGFTVTNGYIKGGVSLSYSAAGIVCTNKAGPILDNLKICYNKARGDEYFLGGGAFCGKKSYPIFRNVFIYKNSTDFAANSSGGVLCKDSSDVMMVNCTIKDNSGSDGGGIGCMNALLELYECRIENNHAHLGGGIYGFHSDIRLNGVSVTGNISGRGGGLYFHKISGRLVNVSINQNKVSTFGQCEGGGLYARLSDLFLKKCKIHENIATMDYRASFGGGLSLNENQIIIQESTIENNHARYGGGISCFRSEVELYKVVLEKNFANKNGNGGGIYLKQSSLELTETIVRRNVSQSYGGGIYIEYDDRFPTGTLFSDEQELSNIYLNKAFYGGGDVACSFNCPMVEIFVDTFTTSDPDQDQIYPLDRINVTMNQAFVTQKKQDLYVSPNGSDSNAGILPSQAFKTVDHALFVADADRLNPITIHLTSGIYSKTETGENFPLFVPSYVSLVGENMKTILDGEGRSGLLRFYKTKGSQIKNMIIERGFAAEGGGIFSQQSQSLFFENLIIRHNRSNSRGGGGMRIQDNAYENILNDNIHIKNVSFVNNQFLPYPNNSTRGSGGLEIKDAKVNIVSSTFANNLSEKSSEKIYAGGISILGDESKVNIINNIVFNNQPNNIMIASIANPQVHFAYSNIQNGLAGVIGGADSTVSWLEGNIDADPRFLGGEPFDYRLTRHSPCIDSGTPFYVWKEDTLVDLTPDQYLGSAPDMGAFEFDPDTGVESGTKQPAQFRLEQNYPNPFNPTTTICYALPEACHVKLTIMDSLGRTVAVLIDKQQRAGRHEILWDGKNDEGALIASGVYFYKLTGGEYGTVRKLLFVR